MKKLFLIALLGAMTFIGCQTDDDATTQTDFHAKTAEPPLNLSFSVNQSGQTTLYNYTVPYVIQKIDCTDNVYQAAGQYIITTPSGKRFLGMWQDRPFVGASGTLFTGKAPNGSVRYFQTVPLLPGLDCDDYIDK